MFNRLGNLTFVLTSIQFAKKIDAKIVSSGAKGKLYLRKFELGPTQKLANRLVKSLRIV